MRRTDDIFALQKRYICLRQMLRIALCHSAGQCTKLISENFIYNTRYLMNGIPINNNLLKIKSKGPSPKFQVSDNNEKEEVETILVN